MRATEGRSHRRRHLEACWRGCRPTSRKRGSAWWTFMLRWFIFGAAAGACKNQTSRMSFWQAAVDGRAPIDVGGDLSLSQGAVRVAKSRVLRRLREEVGGVLE